MKTVYVAGPIGTGLWSEQEANCRRAQALAVRLSRAGMAVVCVHGAAIHELATRLRLPDGRTEQCMAQDIELLSRCDAVVLVTADYHHSVGTCREVEHAKAIGIPVMVEAEAYRWAGVQS